METINIRGVRFCNVTLDEAAAWVADTLAAPAKCPRTVFTPNSEIVQLCIEAPEHYALINSADLIIPDGIGVIKASRILGTPLKEKVAGIELGERTLALAAEQGYSVYFLGAKPGVAEQAAAKMKEKYPTLTVAGTHDGYFKKEGNENESVLSAIRAAAPDVLYVCLGVPAQEKWIAANREALAGVKLCLALGGSLDVWAGNVKRAPKLFIKLGLEWFYRLCKEPRRIGRMMKLPKFLFGTYAAKWRGGEA
ncbi:MAG: WecB/TagA/CpsF family glycosyltransferase [Clostridia bacterium]|nr:WecB/TagA/CpsF family glycosyltransferase [Clostridia bacterium]